MAKKYVPHGLAIHVLDKITTLFEHPDTKVLKDNFKGKTFMCKFPGGQLYFESKLSLDADGSPVYAPQDPTGQLQTAVKDAEGNNLDSDLINYFVLPGGFFSKHGITKGDIGIVIYGVWSAYACFGDVGPSGSLGEGSISLHRELGHETIADRHTETGGRLINEGIKNGVITIVFPGSGNGLGRRNGDSAAIGTPLFDKLKKFAADFASRPNI